jgi:mercuric ion transport protein
VGRQEIALERIKTNGSVAGSVGLALLGTTCCALPILLVALGAGGAVAAMVSAMPWLVPLSQYKYLTFGLTAVVLVYSWYRVHQVSSCDVADGRRLKRQRLLLWGSTGIFLLALFAAYALLPIILWLENHW